MQPVASGVEKSLWGCPRFPPPPPQPREQLPAHLDEDGETGKDKGTSLGPQARCSPSHLTVQTLLSHQSPDNNLEPATGSFTEASPESLTVEWNAGSVGQSWNRAQAWWAVAE